MRVEIVLRYIGVALIFNALFLFIAFFISVYFSESADIPFLYSALIALIFGLFPIIYVQRTDFVSLQEGIAIIVFGWIATCLIGALPYLLWGGEFTFINAWFESVSGFTTTGSTIVENVEALPKSFLFWRSSTHWIGGIGIIFFTLLILPKSNTSNLTILNSEMSKLAKAEFRVKAREIIRILVYVYLGLTILEIAALCFAGMSFFDAINHSFATIATGGFSTRNNSIASFHSLPIEIIIMVFMVLAGLHFGLIFNTVLGRKNNLFHSSVIKGYIIFLIGGTILVSLKLTLTHVYPFWEALRYSAFQVISLGSTTGFATTDTSIWPGFTQILLLYFTIQCATAGSTSGGLKFDRVWIFLNAIGKQIRKIQHPNAVIILKLGNKPIDENLENHTLIFIILYLLIIFITTLILSFLNVDFMTAVSSSAATIGNVGPGFGKVGSMSNFNLLPDLGKFFLTLNMLLGRLEIFGIISLFFVRSWK